MIEAGNSNGIFAPVSMGAPPAAALPDGLHLRASLMALPYPIQSCLSRRHGAALRLAPERASGAAVRPGAHGKRRERGGATGGGRCGARGWGGGAKVLLPFLSALYFIGCSGPPNPYMPDSLGA